MEKLNNSQVFFEVGGKLQRSTEIDRRVKVERRGGVDRRANGERRNGSRRLVATACVTEEMMVSEFIDLYCGKENEKKTTELRQFWRRCSDHITRYYSPRGISARKVATVLATLGYEISSLDGAVWVHGLKLLTDEPATDKEQS